MGKYGNNEFNLAKVRSAHGVRVGADQLICIATAIEQMPARFTTEEFLAYLDSKGMSIQRGRVTIQLGRLRSMVKAAQNGANAWVKVRGF